MINLDRVEAMLTDDVLPLVKELHGIDITDDDPHANPTGSKRSQNDRRQKAEVSKNLLLLAARLDLASALVTNEYWFLKGEVDPLDESREA